MKAWWPLLVCCLLTPLFVLLGVASAGAGHGDYRLAKLLFPFTMVSTSLFGAVTEPLFALALVQYPVYGLVLGLANHKGKLAAVASAVLAVHVLAVYLCVWFPNPSFS